MIDLTVGRNRLLLFAFSLYGTYRFRDSFGTFAFAFAAWGYKLLEVEPKSNLGYMEGTGRGVKGKGPSCAAEETKRI
jgi:hypothetical protein